MCTGHCALSWGQGSCGAWGFCAQGLVNGMQVVRESVGEDTCTIYIQV